MPPSTQPMQKNRSSASLCPTSLRITRFGSRNALWASECPLGIRERHTMLFDIHGILRIIPFECTFSHNANMISNPSASLQYENIAIYTYGHADASTPSSNTSRQFNEWFEKPGERNSHKAVPFRRHATPTDRCRNTVYTDALQVRTPPLEPHHWGQKL